MLSSQTTTRRLNHDEYDVPVTHIPEPDWAELDY